MKFKAVFFDLDGTLANSLLDLAASVNYVLKKHNFKTHPVESYKYFAGDGIPTMIKRALPDNVEKQVFEAVKADFMEYYSKHYADETVPFDGLKELVYKLKSLGIKIAVVTNKAQEAAEKVVFSLFGDVFDEIIGMREGIPAKPDPTAVFMAMENLNVKPSECAFVGDTSMDISAGVNAGAYPVGVLWGFREKEELSKAGALSFAQNADELEHILV